VLETYRQSPESDVLKLNVMYQSFNVLIFQNFYHSPQSPLYFLFLVYFSRFTFQSVKWCYL